MHKISLDVIRVKSPCTVPWQTMAGDETVRFCKQCNKNVYNISALAREEAEALINHMEGRLCVRYFSRADGTVVTRECNPVPNPFPQLRRLAATMLTFVAFTAIAPMPGCAFMGVPRPPEGEPMPPASRPATGPTTSQILELPEPPQEIMGDMAICDPPSQVPGEKP